MMRIERIFYVLFVLALGFAPARAADFKPDTNYVTTFSSGDVVQQAHKEADGSIIIGGKLPVGSSGYFIPFVKRLTADGFIDSRFSAPVQQMGSVYDGIDALIPQTNGKYLIVGLFKINNVQSRVARLNSDGSIDATFPVSMNVLISEVQADQKYLGCKQAANQQPWIPVRFNPDGSVDPTFSLTFVGGSVECPKMKVQPDGKILIAGKFTSGGTGSGLYRLNPDGSRDTSFNSTLSSTVNITPKLVQPDGKIIVISNNSTYRLSADGSVDFRNTACGGSAVLQLADGSYFMSACTVSSRGPVYELGKVKADGKFDARMDHFYIQGVADTSLKSIIADGTGGYFLFGGIRTVAGHTSYGIARIVPNTTPLKAKYDFDGDGKSDIAVYRPSNGYWYIMQSLAGARYDQWGTTGDVPAAAHFDTDGKLDIAVWRPGQWQAYTSEWGHRYTYIGEAGDRPISGDFNSYSLGNSIATYGVRGGTVRWFVKSGNSMINPFPASYAEQITVDGHLTTDRAFVADMNGDSREDLGYFRDGVWYTEDANEHHPAKTFQWGMAGDIPVPGDYDGDREADYAVFRPSTGVWWVNLTSGGYWAIQFGQNGDVPVPADYDGDGKADIAVFRDGVWWQFLSATQSLKVDYWGTAGDIPVPAQNQ